MPINIIAEANEVQEPESNLGIYPLAGAFYTAFDFGQEEGFPVPNELNEQEKARYEEARSRVCQAIREDRPIIEHDGGDDAVILMLGRIPANRGSASQISMLLEAVAIRGQLTAFYDQLNGVVHGMD